MKNMLMRFWQEEKGFGTVELVILLGVLVAIALLFSSTIKDYVGKLMGIVFDDSAPSEMKKPPTVKTGD